MERLLLFDQQLFLFINHLPHTPIFDALALTISGIGKGGLLFLLLGLLLFVREERKDHSFIFSIAGALTTSWLLAEVLLKPFIAKSRPFLFGNGEFAIVVDTITTGFSFPSSHATIAWALAVVLARKESRWRWGLYIVASLVSLSRVYLGVHFPIDVVSGAFIGWGIGRLILFCVNGRRRAQRKQQGQFGTRQKKRKNGSLRR